MPKGVSRNEIYYQRKFSYAAEYAWDDVTESVRKLADEASILIEQ